MKAPPTTIHVSICSTCNAIVSAGTRAEVTGKTDCQWCPLGSSTVTVHRYQLAPQKSRNARKSRAR